MKEEGGRLPSLSQGENLEQILCSQSLEGTKPACTSNLTCNPQILETVHLCCLSPLIVVLGWL